MREKMVGSQSLVLSIDVGSSSVRVTAYEVFGEELSEVAAKTIYRFVEIGRAHV